MFEIEGVVAGAENGKRSRQPVADCCLRRAPRRFRVNDIDLLNPDHRLSLKSPSPSGRGRREAAGEGFAGPPDPSSGASRHLVPEGAGPSPSAALCLMAILDPAMKPRMPPAAIASGPAGASEPNARLAIPENTNANTNPTVDPMRRCGARKRDCFGNRKIRPAITANNHSFPTMNITIRLTPDRPSLIQTTGAPELRQPRRPCRLRAPQSARQVVWKGSA